MPNPPDPIRPTAAEGIALHDRLHALILTHFGDAKPIAVLAALTYELTSHVAQQTTDVVKAHALLEDVIVTMHMQLDVFGVGTPHP